MNFFGLSTDDLVSKRKTAREEGARLDALRERAEVEKGDFLALLIAASMTIVPVVLGILLLYYLISRFFFG